MRLLFLALRCLGLMSSFRHNQNGLPLHFKLAEIDFDNAAH